MKISLVNSTVTFFDSKSNLHMNTNLTKEQISKIQELIHESVNPKASKKQLEEIELKLLEIITPKFLEAEKEVKQAKKEVDEIKSKANKFSLSTESSKYFAKNEEGEIYYKGFKNAENVILPNELVEYILSVEESGESILPYVRFWELALANPDSNARDGLFKFVKKQKLIITENGYIVCYRRANIIDGEVEPKLEYILNEITRLRRQKGNLNKYSFAVNKDGEFLTLDHRTKRYIDFVGEKTTYYELSQKYENGNDTQIVLTDAHTGKMRFTLGSIVSIPREKCDSNPKNECSHGLHIGSRSYVGSGEMFGKAVLLCLVNPSKVVSVPYADAHKMRVCEYKIISLHKSFSEIENFEDSNIKIMEHDYINHEVNEIKTLLENKTFDKENYSNNAEVFLKYAKALKEVQFSNCGLLIDNKELENLRRKINRKK